MHADSIAARLRSDAFFGGLEQDHLTRLASIASVQELRPQEVLFRQDSPADRFFLVLEGKISVAVPALYGPPLTMHEVGPGDPLGWSWLFPPYRWHFEARATEPTRLLSFDARSVRDACEADPAFGYEIVKRFATMMKQRLESARRSVMDTYGPYA